MECAQQISQSVTDPKEIDLTRHALIEASAGTGKTYTIENLVGRLIVERADIAIENILLVTFTDKAASELKVRIREKLEQQYIEAKAAKRIEAGRLKEALDGFDQAAVFTIHGFCQNLLSELAFENNTLFETELKDDRAIYSSLLKELIRKEWPERYGVHLTQLLYLCRFAGDKDRLLDKIIHLARNFSAPAGDRLMPEPTAQTFELFYQHLRNQTKQLAGLLSGSSLFSDSYAKLNINAATKKSLINNVLLPLEKLLLDGDSKEPDINGLSNFFITLKSKKKRIADLVPSKWTKKGENLNVCPQLEKVVAAALDLERQIQSGRYWIIRETIITLKEAVARKKEQYGWISFDDMLMRVYSALYSESGTLLLERIREKYKIAFVDEFQDTDPIQWGIFERIFITDSDQRDLNPLIIIGDPKQAIYSFRGADVYAYLKARAAMAELSQKKQANLYSLAHNYRSMPELIHGFNELFAQQAWFSTEDDSQDFKITYSSALSPGVEKLPFRVVTDNSSRKALNLLDLRGFSSTLPAKRAMGSFIISEIQQLVAEKSLWFQKNKEAERPLNYGDICILVRNRSDALNLEVDLQKAGIPFSFYKKPGLFQSEQADALSLVLHAVLDPGNGGKVKKALLTPFLDADPLFLYSYNDAPVTHPVRRLLLVWNDLALKRRWEPLFQSLMEDSGLIFRLSVQPDWDRVHTNFSQIFEHLESEAYRRNLDFRALLALLDSYRLQTIAPDQDADIHQIETEVSKVKIMTMHVSKGLQFPIVFIAGGLTQPVQSDYHVFHQAKEGSSGEIERVFDLAKTSGDLHIKEQEDEDRRLFYVALTRAQVKLYLPYFPSSKKSAWLGPLAKFIAASIDAAFGPEYNSAHTAFFKIEELDLKDHNPTSRISLKEDGQQILQNLDYSLPPKDDFRARKITLSSYSSVNAALTRNSYSDGMEAFHANLLTEKDLDDDTEAKQSTSPSQLLEPEESSQLPAGPLVGSMLHDILEQIDYRLVYKNPTQLLTQHRVQSVIARNMALYRMNAQWIELVADLVKNTLTAPIIIDGETLLLGQLPPKDRAHEVEFYFPYIWKKAIPVPTLNQRIYRDCDGYIRGYIDLIFRFKGRYYLADWKSNLLEKGYDQDVLQESMDHAGYHLQYRIYAIALLRWLEQATGSVTEALNLFGGIFYFYLRGMGGEGQQGIYYVSPQKIGPRDSLENELVKTVKRAERQRMWGVNQRQALM